MESLTLHRTLHLTLHPTLHLTLHEDIDCLPMLSQHCYWQYTSIVLYGEVVWMR